MTSDVANMTRKEDRTSLFGNNVSSIQVGGNIFNSNEITFNPIKESIVSDVNVMRLFSRLAGMSHESTAIVLI